MLPIMKFPVAQESFSGPLGLLLEMIEKEKLAIAEVSLGKVADEFLAYIETHEVPAEELADFLSVAARLIYIKSRELMPYVRLDEEDEAVSTLEDQLRLYREFVAAAEKLEAKFGVTPMYARPFVRPTQEASFKPALNVTTTTLAETFRTILRKLEPFFALRETSMERVKSIEERVSEMVGALKSRASIRFRDALAGASSKADVVVSFLALLELLRRKIVRVTQKDRFGDITIEGA